MVLGHILKYFSISCKNQSVRIRHPAPTASLCRLAVIPPLCSAGTQPIAPSSSALGSQEQNSPGGTALHATALSTTPWHPAHQPQYFISSKENRQKTPKIFFSHFFRKTALIFLPFLLLYLQDFQQKASQDNLLTQNHPPSPGAAPTSAAGPEHGAVPHAA